MILGVGLFTSWLDAISAGQRLLDDAWARSSTAAWARRSAVPASETRSHGLPGEYLIALTNRLSRIRPG